MLVQTYKEFNRDYGYENVIIDMVTKPIGSKIDLRSSFERKNNKEGEMAEIVDRVSNSGVSKYPQTGDQVVLKFRDDSYAHYVYRGFGKFKYVDNERKISESSKELSNIIFQNEINLWKNFNGSLAT